MPDCVPRLRRMGTIIHIKRNLEMVLADIANDGDQLVLEDKQDGTEVVVRERTVKLYAKEIAQYEALANLTLENNGSEDEGVEKLIALINQK